MDQTAKLPKIWRKNLYSNFGYEDNYTDVTFLKNLRTNVNQKRVSLKEAVIGAGYVTEQVSLVFNFLVVYQLLVDDVFVIQTIFVSSSLLTSLCYLYYLRIRLDSVQLLIAHSKIVFIFFILGYLLSPILKTLTETISTDTINATALVMMFVHLIFFDYKVPAAIASRALALNAAIFGSLCLASRLHSSFHAFVLLTVSAECFVLYPIFAYSVRQSLTLPYLAALIFMTIICTGYVSKVMCISFMLLIIFLNGVFPIMYYFLQRRKNNIYGPWDEAVITSSTYL